MNTQHAVPIPTGAALDETSQPDLLPAELDPESLTIRTQLKSERVQEPQAVAAEEASSTVFVFELTVQPAQPVTLELAEPKITVTVHGESMAGQAGRKGGDDGES